MKRVLYLFLMMVALSCIFSAGHVFAANRSATLGACSAPDDTGRFPYGFMCGTDPSNNHPMHIYANWNDTTGSHTLQDGGTGTFNTPIGGGTLHVKLSWGHAGEDFVTGDPKRDGRQPANQSLVFITMNTASSETQDNMTLINASGNGVTAKLCPGIDPSDTSGKRHGKIWGNRDTTGDYQNSFPATVNDVNESPFAYDGSSQGVVNCQDSGKMAYWIDDTPSRQETYTFDIDINDDADSPSGGNNCLRGDLAIRFGNNNQFNTGDTNWFPPQLDQGLPYQDIPPRSGGGQGVLTPRENSLITATHIVKNSAGICFNIVKPQPVRPDYYWKGTLNATCDINTGVGTIWGRITKYNNNNTPNIDTDDNVILPRPGTSYNIQVQDPSNPTSWSTIGSGSTTPSPGNSSNVGSEYTINFNGSAIFGNGAQRNFRIEHPGGAGWAYLQNAGGGFYRGADLDCLRDPPSVSISADCPAGIIINVSDPDSNGLIHVITKDEAGSVIDDRYTVGTFVLPYDAYLNGRDHRFSAEAVDDTNLATGPVWTPDITGCGRFLLTPQANGFLEPDDEAPSAYHMINTVTLTFPGWDYVPALTINSGSRNYVYKNGAIYATFPGDTTFVNRTYDRSVPITSIANGDLYCSFITIGSPVEGIINRVGNIRRVDRTNGSNTGGCDRVNNKPFFKTYGTGVLAGGNFATPTGGTPACSSSGTLGGWNNNTTTYPNFGASSELHAIALGPITGFSSSRTSDNIRPPTALSFANTDLSAPAGVTNSSYSPKLGGKFFNGLLIHCLPEQLPDVGASTITGNAAFATSGPVTILPNDNQVIHVTGNAYIANNITYDTNGWAFDPNTGTTNIPSFKLLVDGDINIAPNVTILDGLYQAKGRIFTCASASSPISDSQIYNVCKNQLTVHGAFVARKVNLLRTYGSLRNEKPTTPGTQIGLVWSCGGGVCNPNTTGMDCTNITEHSELASSNWHDNNLCVPSSSGVVLRWSEFGSGGAYPNTAAGMKAYTGLPYCTQWLPDYELNVWTDNWLCSNRDLTFSFKGTIAGKFCTSIIEPSDLHADAVSGSPIWNSNNTYICEPLAAASTPPSPLVCSNAGIKSFTRKDTCAAEVFDFTPEFYLSQNPSVVPDNEGVPQWQSNASLPPVL